MDAFGNASSGFGVSAPASGDLFGFSGDALASYGGPTAGYSTASSTGILGHIQSRLGAMLRSPQFRAFAEKAVLSGLAAYQQRQILGQYGAARDPFSAAAGQTLGLTGAVYPRSMGLRSRDLARIGELRRAEGRVAGQQAYTDTMSQWTPLAYGLASTLTQLAGQTNIPFPGARY
jgi:hypothetical protein